ncbi:hypothetical protein BDV93DRAFT_559582 [Ceratobasidium sp. AG-I]|nr:hypothetical protein BDV93DRAFT_559582 [Ceratobasidium sp. AG-I]
MLNLVIISLTLLAVTGLLTVTGLIPALLTQPILLLSGFFAPSTRFYLVCKVVTSSERHEDADHAEVYRTSYLYALIMIALEKAIGCLQGLVSQVFCFARCLVLLAVMFLFRKVRAKCPGIFKLSGCTTITMLITLGVTIHYFIRGLKYLAVVVAGPLRVLRAVCALEYVPLHVIVGLGLVYKLREPLARYRVISPIVSVVVAFCDFVLPGKTECNKEVHMKLIQSAPTKPRYESVLYRVPPRSRLHQTPHLKVPTQTTTQSPKTPTPQATPTSIRSSPPPFTTVDHRGLVCEPTVTNSTPTSAFSTITRYTNYPKQLGQWKPQYSPETCREKCKDAFEAAEGAAATKELKVAPSVVAPGLGIIQSTSNNSSVQPTSPMTSETHSTAPTTPTSSAGSGPRPATPTRVARCYVTSQIYPDPNAKRQSDLKLPRSKSAVRVSLLYASPAHVQTRDEMLVRLVARGGLKKHCAIAKGKLARRSMRASSAAAPVSSAGLSPPGADSMQLDATNLSAAPGVSLGLGADGMMDVDVEAGPAVEMDVGGVQDVVMELVRPIVTLKASRIARHVGLPPVERVSASAAQPTAWSWIRLPRGSASQPAASTNTRSSSSFTSGSSTSSGHPSVFAPFPSQAVIWTLDQEGKVPAPIGGVRPGAWIWRRDPGYVTVAVRTYAPKQFWIQN